MSNETDLCNDALGQIGHNFITSIDDPTRPATVCKRFFASTRDQVLQQHDWHFARKRRNLVRLATAPLFEWSFQYTLPPDCIRPLRIGDTDSVPWTVEARNLLTNEEAVSLLFIRREEDPVQWDPLFIDSFTTRLASKLAISIAHDIQFGTGLLELYKALLLDAAGVESQQGTPNELRVPDLIDIRTVP